MPTEHDTCWNCMDEQQKFRCKGCGFAVYCSQVCQKEHWKALHGTHCKYLSGEKKLAGSDHSSDNCVSCKKQSINYKKLHKKDSPGMACYHKMFDNDLQFFKQKFEEILMTNLELYKKNEPVRGICNLPFHFGEISGNYIDYLDKLLGFLQSLLCHLLYRYPKIRKLGGFSNMLVVFRAYHWAASLQTSVTSERVALTLNLIRSFFIAGKLLNLNKVLGKLEFSHEKVTAWNTFMFLYEMLGVSALIFPLVRKDVNTYNEEDIQRVRLYQTFPRTIKGKEHKILVSPQELQVLELIKQFESFEICDINFNLKPFYEIYGHFAFICDEADIIAQKQGIPKINPYSCELCLTNVDPKKCHYVYNSMWFLDVELSRIQGKSKMTWDEERAACASLIVEEKAYITFSIGSGLRVICNRGDCKDIYENHVAIYRIQICQLTVNMIAKYQSKFKDLKCWVCKLLSGNSHRCSTCKSRLYCSKECQNKDWNVHRTICEDLKQDGNQTKIDSHERLARGDLRATKTYEELINECRCGKADCSMVNDMKKYYGKMDLQETTETEDEVD